MATAKKKEKVAQLNYDPNEIGSLRKYYHSVNELERKEAIDLYSAMNNVAATRELILLYYDCEWRSTKLYIIQSLAKSPNERSIEFLIKLATSIDDVPIAESAIWALGASKHSLSSKFLANYYEVADHLIKPFVIAALGHCAERSIVDKLIKDLSCEIDSDNENLLKSLILTLGELKVVEAAPLFEKYISKNHENNNDILISALISISKISRDVQWIESVEFQFKNNLMHYHIYTNAKNQIKNRAQWGLTEYIQKIFEESDFHLGLVYELHSFKEENVKENLKKYSNSENFEKICFILSKLDFINIENWYSELFDLTKLTVLEKKAILNSISQHHKKIWSKVVDSIATNKNEILIEWFRAMVHSCENNEKLILNYISSDDFKSLDDKNSIEIINELYQFALSNRANKSVLNNVLKIFDQIFDSKETYPTRARVLRAFHALDESSKKATEITTKYIQEVIKTKKIDQNYFSSCLRYLEKHNDKKTDILMNDILSVKLNLTSGNIKSILDYYGNKKNYSENKEFENLIKSSFELPEIKVFVLKFLAKHPISNMYDKIINSMNSDEQASIHSIISLKSFKNENCVESLKSYLDSENASLSGRALDTLTALPGLRAKRIVIDYLRDNAHNNDVCDKVIRCLEPTESHNEYFTNVIDNILVKNPDHIYRDGFILLREKFSHNSQSGGSMHIEPKAEDILKIDKQLKDKVVGYESFDDDVKSTLRSAELPYARRELFDQSVDKAYAIVQYCKAVDLLIENSFGKKLLFPKLENALHEFENIIYRIGLNEERPHSDKVVTALGLEKHFTAQNLPLHKMTIISQGIRNGKIVNEHFKIMDGLRAWAIVLLMYCRKIGQSKPIFQLPNATDDQIIQFSKKLIFLQDIRNPLAHRQTEVDFKRLDEVRSEVIAVLNLHSKIFG